MKTEHINLAVELRTVISETDKLIDEIHQMAKGKLIENPYAMRNALDEFLLAGPLATKATALAALVQLETT
jgi:hypothetical protein